MTKRSMPNIGFVIISFNSDKYIAKCLDSILDIKDFRPIITVIDNGSSDSTPTILSRYEDIIKSRNLNHHFTYLGHNHGTTYSRNLGLKFLTTNDVDYICILDSDATINDPALHELIKQLSAPRASIVGPRMTNSTQEIQCSARKFPTLTCKLLKASPFKQLQQRGENLEKYTFQHQASAYEVDYLLSACWLMTPETIESVGLFDENIFYAPEDVDYCLRIYQAGLKCLYAPKAKITHEYQRVSKQKLISMINLRHIQGLIYYFFKHRYLFRTPKFSVTRTSEDES